MSRLKALRVSSDRKLLEVQRTEPEENFKQGGCLYGYRREYGVNKYSLLKYPEHYQEDLGLDICQWIALLRYMIWIGD